MPFFQKSRVYLVILSAIVFGTTGCGGSGGGNSSAKPVTPVISISWPARALAFQGPTSAQSAVIELRGASTAGKDVAFIANRINSSQSVQSYTCPVAVRPGVHPLVIHFDAAMNGVGGEVATAAATVQITPTGSVLRSDGKPLGNIGFTSAIGSVYVLQSQTATIGQPYAIQVGATDKNNYILALSPGSATFKVIQGNQASIDASQNLVVTTLGSVTVQATIDGVSSGYMDIGVQAPLAKLRSVNLTTNALVLKPQTGTLWTSVPSTAASHGNEVVEIDPVAGSILGGVFAGSEPGPLGISGDGTTLFVGLTGALAIQPIKTATRTLGTIFSLSNPQSSYDPPATQIQVQPGSTNTIAVVRNPGSSLGPELYIGGVQAPNALGGYSGTSVTFSSATELFSYDGYTSGYELIDASIDGQGITQLSSTQGLINGYGVTIAYVAGRIYASDGSIIDAATKTRIGQFNLTGGGNNSSQAISFTIDAANHRAFFISNGFSSNSSVMAFDTTTFLPVGVVNLPSLTFDQGLGSNSPNLVRFGQKGLAFRTPTGVYFLDTAPGL